MSRYLITQSLIASWAYMFDCRKESEKNAEQEFLQVLRREARETTEARQNGIYFENAVYAEAAGVSPKPECQWENGVKAVANIIRGAQMQVRLSRPLTLDGMKFLVYGILDALKAGVIYDVKFQNKKFSISENDPGEYGKFLNSPQHPFYFFLVPEALEFKYLLSDGEDLYIETYQRDQTRSAEAVIAEFIHSIAGMGLLDAYKEKWLAK